MQPWLIAIIVVASVLVLFFLLAILSYMYAFGRRYDKGRLLKYFSFEEFGLNAEPVELVHGLRGALYDKGEYDKSKILIFVHGMGAGHAPYMTEIAYFCNSGYRVLAVDSKGCGDSSGKNIGGMYEGVKTAISAIDFAKSRFPQCAIYLVGHSWGGYSVLCASAKRKVEKVVAISAPNTPVRTIYEGAAKFISKPVAAILCPFWGLINFLKFGINGNLSATKCARKNGTPTLLIHGDSDGVVTPKKAVYFAKFGENVTKYLAEGKAHNPYNTVAAEKKLFELQTAIGNSAKMTEEERVVYFKNFDYAAATEEDFAVMQKIIGFLEN